MEHSECCCHKTRTRSEEEYQSLIHRLNRIEGQIRGIRGMVEKNAYCTDILIQSAAGMSPVDSTTVENAFARSVSSSAKIPCTTSRV